MAALLDEIEAATSFMAGRAADPVHDRLALGPDAIIRGPALIVGPVATIVVEPGRQAVPDAQGTLVLARHAPRAAAAGSTALDPVRLEIVAGLSMGIAEEMGAALRHSAASVDIRELARLDRPMSAGFERPYGWGWLLALHDEVTRHDVPQWADRECQAWEPGGEDFLSATLTEALLMARILPRGDFRTWFDRFLPETGAGRPITLFTPVHVSDRGDGKIAHRDGLNLSRAWGWREIATALGDGHAVRAPARATADAHLAASLPHLADDYMDSHWLASFALLALEA